MTTKITEQNISELANAGVNWQSVFTGDGSTGLTTVAGRGYFINTTSGTVTVTLPASPSAGDVVVLKDYARTWGTNNVTTASALIDGSTAENIFSTSGQTITLVYMDGTKGWSLINDDTTSQLGPIYISATGGTITTSGDFKIHTFTGDGCFVVSSLGCGIPCAQASSVEYVVVAGGGGGGGGQHVHTAGGGGAGGYRESSGTTHGPYTVSPLGAGVPALPVSATTYPVTVGGGGTGGCDSNPGSNSVFSTITSTGGGGQNDCAPDREGKPGGSGGGGGGNRSNSGGSGNTPPVSPPQGNNGGPGQAPGPSYVGAGGGGGATQTGFPGMPGGSSNGGNGATSSITGSPVTRAGGGGGSGDNRSPAWPGSIGGSGGGGTGGTPDSGGNTTGTSGSANTGGGAGGKGVGSGNAGGKGIVIIRYKFQ